MTVFQTTAKLIFTSAFQPLDLILQITFLKCNFCSVMVLVQNCLIKYQEKRIEFEKKKFFSPLFTPALSLVRITFHFLKRDW